MPPSGRFAAGKLPGRSGKTEISLEDALSKFVADCETRNLKAVTLGKYRLVARTLKKFAESRGLMLLNFAAVFEHHSFSTQNLKNDLSFSIQLAAVFGARSHEARKSRSASGSRSFSFSSLR